MACRDRGVRAMNQTAGVTNNYRRCSKGGKVSYSGSPPAFKMLYGDVPVMFFHVIFYGFHAFVLFTVWVLVYFSAIANKKNAAKFKIYLYNSSVITRVLNEMSFPSHRGFFLDVNYIAVKDLNSWFGWHRFEWWGPILWQHGVRGEYRVKCIIIENPEWCGFFRGGLYEETSPYPITNNPSLTVLDAFRPKIVN